MASSLGRKVMWAVLGGAAMKAARGVTRDALHTSYGAARLPRPVRRQRNLQTALLMAVGTGALLAIADVLQEQGKTAARAREPKPAR
jgi:hypothetical protein